MPFTTLTQEQFSSFAEIQTFRFSGNWEQFFDSPEL